MNKLMLASITVLLAGAVVTPAFAQDDGRRAGGESSWQADGSKGPAVEQRQESREDARAEIDSRRGSRSDARPAPRSNALVAGRLQQRDDRGDWRDNDRDRHDRDDDRNRWQQPQRHDRDGDRDGSRDRYGSRDRDHDWRNEWRNDRHDWRQDHRRDGRYYTRYRDSRWSGYHWASQYRYRAPTRYVYPSGYRAYRWQVGYRMPYQYYGPNYYRVDYRMYRLPPPPYGYTWVRVDRDVVLVSLASGLIRDVLFGLFY